MPAKYKMNWVFFDLRDEQVTEAWVSLDAMGDCPIGVQGIHHKTFPARIPTDEIIKTEFATQQFLMWPLDVPPFEFNKEAGK